jgi:hypothetical protein
VVSIQKHTLQQKLLIMLVIFTQLSHYIHGTLKLTQNGFLVTVQTCYKVFLLYDTQFFNNNPQLYDYFKQSAVLQTNNKIKLTRSADSSMGVRSRWSNVRQPQNCWTFIVKCLVSEQMSQAKVGNLIITRKHLKCEYRETLLHLYLIHDIITWTASLSFCVYDM